jgi:hypothetical protein
MHIKINKPNNWKDVALIVAILPFAIIAILIAVVVFAVFGLLAIPLILVAGFMTIVFDLWEAIRP